MSIFSRIFQWKPKHQVSAYRPVYAAFLDRLAREGVYTGGTGGYPRVEVHSVREGERLDKEGQLRQMTMTIESISTKSMTEAAMMNEENLELLTAQDLMLDDHWLCIGITPTQLQDQALRRFLSDARRTGNRLRVPRNERKAQIIHAEGG